MKLGHLPYDAKLVWSSLRVLQNKAMEELS